MILRFAGAFLLGALPFSFLIGKFLGKDLRKVGSKNPGATNLYRVCGPGPGLLGLALDIAKGSGAAALGGQDPVTAVACGLAGILGHVFTPFLKFSGGKGVATAAGAFAILAPQALAWAVLGFALTLFLSRYVALASSLAALILAVVPLVHGESRLIQGSCALVALLVLYRHRGNFKRMLEGKESKFRFSKEKG